MSREISRETRKLEVRLEDYMKADEEFVKDAKRCITIFKKMGNKIAENQNIEKLKDLSEFRRNAAKSLSKLFSSESKVAHERSHILESYGALILSLEKAFDNLEA